jgi:demethylmenaquinone methyltransferase/2-methoxy-6-polyprenyl-1,4-benzoquinol methylase
MAAPAEAHDSRAYYARRAAEYDAVYAKPERQAELRAIEPAMTRRFAGARVLELACGTGWWTRHGAARAAAWLATDANAETIAVARARPMPPGVRFALADAYEPSVAAQASAAAPFDTAFAGFWWSHVPRARLGAWIAAVRAALLPGARLVLIDNRRVEGSTTPVAFTDTAGDQWQRRRLADGSEHLVLKNFPDAAELHAAFAFHAAALRLEQTRHYWIAEARFCA